MQICKYIQGHTLTLADSLHLVSFQSRTQGEFELEMPWGQALGQCNWELAMPLLLCPWTVGWAYALRCSTPEGLQWQVRPWGLLRCLQADLMGEENSENKMRSVVTAREFFCIDMYPGISLWSRK